MANFIRRFKKEDAKDVSKLISKTFNEFVAPNFMGKGIEKYLKEQTPEKQIEKSKTRDIYVVTVNNKIVGVIKGNKKNKVTSLFVDKKYHGKGIARDLMNKLERLYKKKSAKKMLVSSSLYAQKFYEKIGYKKTTRLIKKEGMVYQPMKKIL
jgi:ribosomal protein S18 acetylase RimI-like enzyme